jgi:hypothetical protein
MNLSEIDAAPLLRAGLTTFNALRLRRAGPGGALALESLENAPDHRGVEGEERDALKTPRLPFRLRRSRRKSVAERLQAVVMWIVSKILRDLFQGPDTGPVTGTDG